MTKDNHFQVRSHGKSGVRQGQAGFGAVDNLLSSYASIVSLAIYLFICFKFFNIRPFDHPLRSAMANHLSHAAQMQAAQTQLLYSLGMLGSMPFGFLTCFFVLYHIALRNNRKALSVDSSSQQEPSDLS